MKVEFNSVDSKNNLWKRAKNLKEKQKGGWTKVFIHQDLTPKKREARKPLVAELKLRKVNGENVTIFNGKIVQTRCSAIAETTLQGALWFSPKVEDWNWETIFYGHYRFSFNYSDIIGQKISRIQ